MKKALSLFYKLRYWDSKRLSNFSTKRHLVAELGHTLQSTSLKPFDCSLTQIGKMMSSLEMVLMHVLEDILGMQFLWNYVLSFLKNASLHLFYARSSHMPYVLPSSVYSEISFLLCILLLWFRSSCFLCMEAHVNGRGAHACINSPCFL